MSQVEQKLRIKGQGTAAKVAEGGRKEGAVVPSLFTNLCEVAAQLRQLKGKGLFRLAVSEEPVHHGGESTVTP